MFSFTVDAVVPLQEGTAHHDGPSTYHTHHVRRRPFTYSDYYQPYDPAAAPYLDRILNVSIDAQLDELIKKVSFKKELIFFAFNSRGAWLDWALAMADQLRRASASARPRRLPICFLQPRRSSGLTVSPQDANAAQLCSNPLPRAFLTSGGSATSISSLWARSTAA